MHTDVMHVEMGEKVERDIGDILDRWIIAKLKAERIGNEENKKEFNAFSEEMKHVFDRFEEYDWQQISRMMYDINSTIWFLEAAMKSGKESLPKPHYLDDKENIEVLSSIGKNAILIRNINGFRVGLKNIINRLVNQGFTDIKQNHMSDNLNEQRNKTKNQ